MRFVRGLTAYYGRYPRFQPRIAEKVFETSFETDQSKPIPQSYSTLLSGMFQLFGDMGRAISSLREVQTG